MSSSTTDPEAPATAGPQVSRDLVAGVVMVAVAAVFLLDAGKVVRGEYSWLFPIVLSYALGALALILIVRGLMGRGERMPIVPTVLRGRGVDTLVFSVLTVIYVALVPHLGFWLTSGLMIAATAIYLESRRSRLGSAVAIGVAVVTCAAGYLTLTEIFYIKFPTGPWGW